MPASSLYLLNRRHLFHRSTSQAGAVSVLHSLTLGPVSGLYHAGTFVFAPLSCNDTTLHISRSSL